MSDLSSVTDNYLPTAHETFTDNLSSSISALATTVPVNSAIEYADGDTVVLTVDAGTADEATFVGKKDTGADQFIECIWTEGNLAVGHDSGATIVDYDSATHYNLLAAALKLIMNQDGTMLPTPIRTALGLSAASTNGWEAFPYTMSVASGYNTGNRSHDLTIAGQDVTGLLSPGMKLRLERDTAAPTQCTNLESGSSQYASKSSPAGITFTTTFTAEAWIKLESYTGSTQMIIGRQNGGTEGFGFRLSATGQVEAIGLRIASNNKSIQSYQSIPLDKWVHIAACIDMTAGDTSAQKIWIDGVEVPRAYTLTGTATALVQGTTALSLGARVSGVDMYTDAKLADVRLWSDIRTATEIQDNMNQVLAGTETGLVAYYPLNGNFEDSTSNENDLTASGSAVATDLDNPFSDTQYGIVTKVAYSAPNSTVTVFTGTDHMIPNMTLTSPFYSTQGSPFGFPRDSGKWSVESLSDTAAGVAVNNKVLGLDLSIPVGAWTIFAQVSANVTRTGGTGVSGQLGVSTSPTSVTEQWSNSWDEGSASTQPFRCSLAPTKPVTVNLASQTIYYAVVGGTFTTCTPIASSAGGGHRLRAECAYL